MIQNHGYTKKTDIFSAGAVFFNLIKGKQPFF
jgi:serine/threonine protein kinase